MSVMLGTQVWRRGSKQDALCVEEGTQEVKGPCALVVASLPAVAVHGQARFIYINRNLENFKKPGSSIESWAEERPLPLPPPPHLKTTFPITFW